MDCAFCHEFARPGEGERIIIRSGDWRLLPTLGCFTEGYCLYLPVEHIDAVAGLSVTEHTAAASRRVLRSGGCRRQSQLVSRSPILLHAMSCDALAQVARQRRWPKWSSMCLLRLLDQPVLNACCVAPGQPRHALRAGIRELAAAIGSTKLMLRSDGGIETHQYYRGGNTLTPGAARAGRGRPAQDRTSGHPPSAHKSVHEPALRLAADGPEWKGFWQLHRRSTWRGV